MKKNSKWIMAAVLSGVLAASGLTIAAYEPIVATGAVNGASNTLEEMLTCAIEDEYAAQAEYEAIMDSYGTVRPFANISKAEARHINELLPLFDTYGVAVPENDAASRVAVPGSLAECYATGVDAEVKNIAMYESFLQEDLPDDVRAVFESLQTASEKHLNAFERNAGNTTGNVSSPHNGRK